VTSFLSTAETIRLVCKALQADYFAMRVNKVRILNFRSLKEIEVDFEPYLSLVVGKNNSGKTSLLLAMERFLSGTATTRFEFDDFNTELQTRLRDLLEGEPRSPDAFSFCGISLRLFIEYADADDLANVGDKVIMDLDPDNRWIILDFLYYLPEESLASFRNAFAAHKEKKTKAGKSSKSTSEFVREEFRNYFRLARRSLRFDHITGAVVEDNYVDLIKENIRIDNIIAFKRINARRSVSNKDSDRGLSTMSARIYAALSTDTEDGEVVENFKDALTATDGQLNTIYANLFQEVVEDIQKFGGVKEGDTRLMVKSTLQHGKMLEDNTTVVYRHGADSDFLPESYNGLGYLNLISIIFEIKILLNEFERTGSVKPADINLLFIEEPEAHTHPQMQSVFIKNIKHLVGKVVRNREGVERPLQTLVSTHSSHIVADSNFDDIKYFQKINGQTRSRNLRELEEKYANTSRKGHYKFLKQYLTLNRSQLFFADKAILVEGDTERILLPAMMRKLDQKDEAAAWTAGISAPLALLSQNITIVEVGAHSHIYELFLDFIGVKTLIITDIDSVKEKELLDEAGNVRINADGSAKKVRIAHAIEGATHTSNYSLQHYHGGDAELDYYLGLEFNQKTLRKDADTGAWSAHLDGKLLCVYQISESNNVGTSYHARSFEDAFFHLNRAFVEDVTVRVDETVGFPSLKKRELKKYIGEQINSYQMAVDGITKKPSFAIEILLNSASSIVSVITPNEESKAFDFEFDNWITPRYIEEGLKWIKLD
jgi:predicted ATP-dependent endonuclease of OLD family